MSVESETRHGHVLGITIGSDREMTLWMAVLFVICGLLLAEEIHRVFQGNFFGPTHVRMNYWSISTKAFETIVAIYFFMFAFRIPKKSVKFASALMGADFSVFVLLSLFSVPATVGHTVAIIGSAARQIALLIFCVAIAQWLKSAVRRSSSTDPQRSNS
jgi:hypothetical protein